MRLAQFLVRQSRPVEAGLVFSNIDPAERLRLPETGPLLTALIQSGDGALARGLWAGLIGADQSNLPLIWNGGFESDIRAAMNQFDWTIAASDYARVSIDTGTVHSGSRSLRLDFAGRDTTRLDGEIKQLVVLPPGAHYRLEFYFRTDHLASPEGPRIQVAESGTGKALAVSDPLAPGTYDWRLVSLEFTTSQGDPSRGMTLAISVIRKPRFSYDEPTKGTIWFDDFEMKCTEN